jgi:AcrR family transcriptional regulator
VADAAGVTRALVHRYFHGIEDLRREVWLSTVESERSRTADDHPGQILRNAVLQRMLANNADIIDDTPWSRLCLLSYIGSSDAVCRQWVLGHATRSQAEQVLVRTLLHTLTVIIPQGDQVRET